MAYCFLNTDGCKQKRSFYFKFKVLNNYLGEGYGNSVSLPKVIIWHQFTVK